MLAARLSRRGAPRTLLHRSRRFSSSSPPEAKPNILGRWAIPTAAGFSLIAFLQWHQLTHPSASDRQNRPAAAMRRLPGDRTNVENAMATQRQLESLKLLPYRTISRWWGRLNEKELPTWLRAPVYKAWTYVFDCNLDEMRDPLAAYENLGAFFSRPLKDGARPFAPSRRDLPSPVDGRVAAVGCVEIAQTATNDEVPILEQIKGARYRMDDFLGELPPCVKSHNEDYKVYHCVLYLAPGDYHRIHSPVNWTIRERRHFPGNLFPVNTTAARLIPSLFVENERVALVGDWAHGFFSLVAVGATNVGSIRLQHEPKFLSNKEHQDKQQGQCAKKQYASPIKARRGDELAQFRLGSTVVLVFEAPASFEFTLKPGDKLLAGQALGHFHLNEDDDDTH